VDQVKSSLLPGQSKEFVFSFSPDINDIVETNRSAVVRSNIYSIASEQS